MTNEVILVTGATGYIGVHVVKLLLERGYKVRATVRSLSNSVKVEQLKELVKESEHLLEMVEVDLSQDEGWSKAASGCNALIHMASPFPNILEEEMSEDDLIIPAKEGTLRALKAAVEASIKKVVLTSSAVSVVGTTDPDPSVVYSEDDWTDPEDPLIDPYTKSKTLAERVAWDYLEGLPEEEKFDLSVINPGLVLGPVLLESNKNSTSVDIMTQILNRGNPAYPKIAIYFCDVRDVAEAHVKALTEPGASGKRHIINTCTMWFRDIAAVVSDEFGPQGYCISKIELPYLVCWFAALFNKSMKNTILPKYGKTLTLSNQRMISVLGISPTPFEKTLKDMAYSIIELGLVKKTKKYTGPPVEKESQYTQVSVVDLENK